MKIKKGDNVRVITGKNRGSEGIVVKALPKTGKLIVEGVNIVKKHKKATANDSKKGIIEVEAPIHASNVMLIDGNTGKTTRKRVEIAVKAKKTVKKKN